MLNGIIQKNILGSSVPHIINYKDLRFCIFYMLFDHYIRKTTELKQYFWKKCRVSEFVHCFEVFTVFRKVKERHLLARVIV